MTRKSMWNVVDPVLRTFFFFYRGPQRLLWDGSRPVRVKVTISGISNRQNYSVIFYSICIYMYTKALFYVLVVFLKSGRK
jgi:hypothetical protein